MVQRSGPGSPATSRRSEGASRSEVVSDTHAHPRRTAPSPNMSATKICRRAGERKGM